MQTKAELDQQQKAAEDATAAFAKIQEVVANAKADYDEAQKDAKTYASMPQHSSEASKMHISKDSFHYTARHY